MARREARIKSVASSDAESDPLGLDGPIRREPKAVAKGVAIAAVMVVATLLLLPSASKAPGASAASTATTVASSAHSEAAAGTSKSKSKSTSRSTTGTKSTGKTSTQSPASANSQIQVLVANGTNTSGEAGVVTKALATKGFGTLTATDALTTVSASQIYPVAASDAAAAQTVATSLSLPSSDIQSFQSGTPVPVSSDTGASVVVIAGPDLVSQYPVTTTAAS